MYSNVKKVDKEGEGDVMRNGSKGDAKKLMKKLQKHHLLASAVPTQHIEAEARLVCL
jgi:hypothetical protein